MSVSFKPRKRTSKGVLLRQKRRVGSKRFEHILPNHVLALMDVCKRTNRSCDISFGKGKIPSVSIRSIKE